MQMRNGLLYGGGAMKSVGALPQWLISHFGGKGNPAAGYEASATLFRAVEIRSQTVAAGELKLYAKDGTEIEAHELLDVLHNVNAEWNYSDLWRYTEAGAMVYGAGYWQKVRMGRRVSELFYLNPSTVQPTITSAGITDFVQGGSVDGRVTGERFDRNDVVYFRGAYNPGSDLTGYAPLRWAFQAAMGEANAEKYLNAFFENGAVPAVVFASDQPMGDPEIEKAVTWWKRLFAGAVNAFKTGFLGRGLKPYTVGSSIKDMELASARTELRRTISIVTGVPEMLFSATDSADLTPVELAMKVLYYTTVVPRWNWYAEVLNAELLSEFDDLVGAGAYLAFDTSNIEVLQEDASKKAERLVALVGARILKPEVAAVELGFDESDVPEPAPAPVIDPVTGLPVPPDNTPADQPAAQPADEPPAQRTIASRDLERWQRKALNALERGKSPAVPFASDAISADEHARISAALAACKSADDVRAVFAEPEPTLAEVLAELRAARQAVERGRA